VAFAGIIQLRIELIRYFSGNGGVDAHLCAASKNYFNWITNDAVIMMQPEGSTISCKSCEQSISKVVLKPFDRVDIIPSDTNLMAVQIPVLGTGKTTYSYWLSYRSNYTESQNGLSMHIVRFNLNTQHFGAVVDTLNFDAVGSTNTTKDSFILNGTCYHIQPPGPLLDVDSSAVEEVQPVVCVDDIDKGNSVTVSVSFLNKNVPQKEVEKKVAQRCSTTGNQGTIDTSLNKVHLLEFSGTGTNGNLSFAICQETTGGSVDAYFYDS
jgi:hypothetical protein